MEAVKLEAKKEEGKMIAKLETKKRYFGKIKNLKCS
jgi:hypothetical protein